MATAVVTGPSCGAARARGLAPELLGIPTRVPGYPGYPSSWYHGAKMTNLNSISNSIANNSSITGTTNSLCYRDVQRILQGIMHRNPCPEQLPVLHFPVPGYMYREKWEFLFELLLLLYVPGGMAAPKRLSIRAAKVSARTQPCLYQFLHRFYNITDN
eukprot:2125330-Rhodomonas_salina.1